MKKIPRLEKFAAQSLVEHNGELIFSKEKFAELIVRECASAVNSMDDSDTGFWANIIKKHFGVEE